MTVENARILVHAGDSYACVKITGRATFASSVEFRTLLAQLTGKGCKYFVLELSECALMDSTFLGVLAGFGLRVGGPHPREEDKAIELFNPTPRVQELLDNLGILHLFKLGQGATPCATHGVQPVLCQPVTASREDLTRASLEAHQTLMDINPENVARFKDVTRFLAEDLQKLRPPAP